MHLQANSPATDLDEPHDQDLQAFSISLQQAINAIRGQGANSQYILLPGIDFQHADTFLSLSKPILAGMYDPAGGQSLLIYDIHQYLDADESGRSPECVTSRADLWAPIATDLRRSGRKAMVTEIGGGSTSCKSSISQRIVLALHAANPLPPAQPASDTSTAHCQ